jgi:mannose-6-phosphate isomerase-like protein (cupin superfamily)
MSAQADSRTAPSDGYTVAHRDELERTGNWTLVRRSLDCRSFGVNLVEIAPGESIPEHDETQRDQEELFFVISGSPVLVIDGKDHPARPGTFARIDPRHVRTVRSDGPEPASVLIVSAPTTSGFEPMDWA